MSDKNKSVKIKLLSLGSDPEFLIQEELTGKLISSFGIIEGEKDAPISLVELGDGYTIQKDNVLLEICVPPSSSSEDLYNSIVKTINYIEDNILPGGLKVLASTGGEYEYEQLDSDFARTFGCSESYNAWNYSVNRVESNYLNPSYRGAGFHIHIGYENPDINLSVLLVRALDIFVGVPSVLFDDDRIRRNQYGTAGEFRETKYGCEYRVLGGYVMKDKKYYDAAIKGLNKAIDFVNSDKISEMTDEDQLMIQTCINTNNKDLAKEIVDKYSIQDIVLEVV